MDISMYNQLKALLGNPLDTIVVASTSGGPTDIEALWKPIFDRTLADCVYGNPKGSFDYICANRIEANLGYVCALLDQDGIYTHPTKWTAIHTQDEIFTYADYERIRQNYVAVVTAIERPDLPIRYVAAGTPLLYTDINRLEQIVAIIRADLDRLLDSCFITNEIMCGEE